MRLLGTLHLARGAAKWQEDKHMRNGSSQFDQRLPLEYWKHRTLLTCLCPVLPRTRSVSSSCSEMPRTSAPAASQRRGYVSLSSTHPTTTTVATDILLTAIQLGTFGRAKRKVEEMTNVIQESRRAGHH